MVQERSGYMPVPAQPTEPAIRKDRQFVTALARGLTVLRSFSERQSELGTADIAKLTKLPHTTVWRICSTLIDLGYLIRIGGTEKLRVGLPILRFGDAALRDQSEIIERLRPHMDRLESETDGALTLAAPAFPFMVCLERYQGSAVFVADTRIGTLIPLPKSSLGWAYMAGLGAGERELLIRKMEEMRLPAWQQFGSRFAPAYAGFMKTGYLVSVGTLHPSLNAVAIPLMTDKGELLSLSCGGLASTFGEKLLHKIGPMLVDVADQLGLRFRPGAA